MPAPAAWGPSLWKVLHGLGALRFPENILLKKDAQRELLWIHTHLDTILFCEECRTHTVKYKKTAPFEVETFGLWFYTFHDAVNRRLGKEEGPPFTQDLGVLSGKEIRRAWTEFKGKCGGAGQLAVKTFERHLHLCLGFFGLP
jgi:hypothetical protein